MSKKLYDDLKEVIMLPGISGYEDAVRDYVRKYVGKNFKTEEDAIGNLILNMGGTAPAQGKGQSGGKGPSIAVVASVIGLACEDDLRPWVNMVFG